MNQTKLQTWRAPGIRKVWLQNFILWYISKQAIMESCLWSVFTLIILYIHTVWYHATNVVSELIIRPFLLYNWLCTKSSLPLGSGHFIWCHLIPMCICCMVRWWIKGTNSTIISIQGNTRYISPYWRLGNYWMLKTTWSQNVQLLVQTNQPPPPLPQKGTKVESK